MASVGATVLTYGGGKLVPSLLCPQYESREIYERHNSSFDFFEVFSGSEKQGGLRASQARIAPDFFCGKAGIAVRPKRGKRD